jgi:nitroreductase
MEAVDALLSRVSAPRLTGSVPASLLADMVQAAQRAPDHAQLSPYRFLAITGDGRTALGELMVAARLADAPDTDVTTLDKLRLKPLRAPMIIVGIASPTPHPKVPEIEQLLTAGIALQNMSSMAWARGFGAIWRTGDLAYSKHLQAGLGLVAHEQITGFLYIGEVEGRLKTPSKPISAELLAHWP